MLKWLKLRSIETGLSLRQEVLEEFRGESQNRLMATLVKEELARGNFDLGYLDEVLPQLSKGQWKTYLQGLQSSLKLGVPLQSVTFETLEGGSLSLEELTGEPTLFYFYFSTCAHSANYFDRFLWPIYQETAKQAGYRLLAVSIDDDPELWKSSIQEYSDPSLVNLNLPKSENKNWLDHYRITAFPRTILLDSKGRLLSLNLTGEDYENYKSNLLEYLNPSTISSKTTITP